MKVLQIMPSVSLVYGGPSQMIRGLSAALAHQGVDLTLITTNSNGDVDQAPLDVPLNTPIQEEGYQVYYFRCAPARRYKFSLGLLQWLWHHAPEFDVAHIHALFSPVSTAAAVVCRWRGLPYILRPLGTLDPADLRKKRWLKQWYGTWLEGPNLGGAAAVHFTSQEEARVSHRFGAKTRDVVIPLGVQGLSGVAGSQGVGMDRPQAKATLRSSLGIAEDCPLLLFMSRLDPKKGLDLLIPALEQLRSEGVMFHWLVAGANPQDPTYGDQVKQRVEASNLSPCTSFLGFVQGEQKRSLLAAADVFTLPSYYENFGIAVAEAMGAGLPVVITPGVYIWQELQEAGAGWIVPLTVEGLAQGLREALTRADLRVLRGRQAQTYARRQYNWQTIAEQMIQVYESLI